MPIEWTADPQTRRIAAYGLGTVTAADWEAFIKGQVDGGVRGYAKLLDLSQANVEISAAEILAIARTVNRLADEAGDPLGPAAFVIDSGTTLERLMQFDDRTATGHRPMAIFPTRQLALDWLDSLGV